MHVVIATFEAPDGAEAFTRALREVFGVTRATRDQRIGAQGEPYDGHLLVVAWVPRRLAGDIRDCAQRFGGVLHAAPASAAPPGATADSPASRGRRVMQGSLHS